MLLLIYAAVWVYGERLLYIALYVFLLMPVASYLLTYILLRSLQISQTIPHTVVKNETGYITLYFHSVVSMFIANIKCEFYTDDFAVETQTDATFMFGEKESAEQNISFTMKYRGKYQIGLKNIYAVDFMRLFRLRRKINKQTEITVLPRIIDLTNFPLTMNLLTQAHSRFDIKDEDYATISDIRPYLPTDSIKRVHWKLTAKRNEWLVKNFQSNALNKVTVILDSKQLPLRYKEKIILEDRLIELAMGITRFCLRKGMPVDFAVGEGHTLECQNTAMFETVYQTGSKLVFNDHPLHNPLSMLSHALNEATGYLNAVIMTPRLDFDLYERIVNGVNNGHYIAVLYFSTIIKDMDSEKIYKLLSESNIPCFRITDESLVDEGV